MKAEDSEKPEIYQAQNQREDYRAYSLSFPEAVIGVAVYGLICLGISLLFYRTVIPWPFLMAGSPLVLVMLKRYLCRRRREELARQFCDGMSAYAGALRCGFSPETGIGEAISDLEGIYGGESLLVNEFRQIQRSLSLGETIENLLMDFGMRSGLSEARDMAEVFAIAKRSGGSLSGILKESVKSIEERNHIENEILTMISGKKFEERIMYLMPSGILLYINLTSPDFTGVLYEGLTGRMIMTILLVVYAFTIFLGERIMRVKV